MSDWVTATIDPNGETVFLNLSLAIKMERRAHTKSTTIQFAGPTGASLQSVREMPNELLAQIKR